MKNYRSIAHPLPSLLALSLFACGGKSTSADDSQFDSGVEPSKSVDALTLDERQSICLAHAEYILNSDAPELLCRLVGVEAARQTIDTGEDPVNTCSAGKEECLHEANDTSDLCTEPEANTGCPATVADYETCLQSISRARVESYRSLDPPLCETAESYLAQLESGEVEATAPIQVTELEGCNSLPHGCFTGM